MSSHTRGPQRGHVPPHVQDRLRAKRERAEARARRGPWYRRPSFVAPVTALVFVLIGLVVGNATSPDELAVPDDDVSALLFLSDQVDGVWVRGAGGTAPVEEGIAALEEGDPSVVEANLVTWGRSIDAIVQGYDSSVDVVPAAEGPRRLLVEAARMTREAIDTVGAAATLEGQARALTLDSARRLRLRAQQLDVDARELLQDRNPDFPVVIPDLATEVPTLPQPTPPPPSPEPTEGAAPSPAPSPSDTIEATPEASPTTP